MIAGGLPGGVAGEKAGSIQLGGGLAHGIVGSIQKRGDVAVAGAVPGTTTCGLPNSVSLQVADGLPGGVAGERAQSIQQGGRLHRGNAGSIQKEEVARPVDKIVVVPQVQYAEKIVEAPQVLHEEGTIEVPEVKVGEMVKQVPKPVMHNMDKEVPKHKNQCVEKVIETPTVVTQEQVSDFARPVPVETEAPVPDDDPFVPEVFFLEAEAIREVQQANMKVPKVCSIQMESQVPVKCVPNRQSSFASVQVKEAANVNTAAYCSAAYCWFCSH